MIILMNKDASAREVEGVVAAIDGRGLRALRLPGSDHTAVGIASAIAPEIRGELAGSLEALPGVSHVVHVSRPYKLASREFQAARTVVDVGGVAIGGTDCVVIAGPCAVESREQIFAAARAVKAAGAVLLRGGAFKPRTSPYSFQGLNRAGLELLKEVRDGVGLPTVTEVIDPHDVDVVAEHADMLQIGARNMQNFPLLIAAGQTRHPVLLKRGPSASLDELLFAAEYILHQGNERVILCERGVHPLDRTYTRNTLDLNAVPVLKDISHLPVLVDPSHGIGHARYVPDVARAAIAAGADGLIVEVHPDPAKALSDGQQSLTPEAFSALTVSLRRIAAAVDRGVAAPEEASSTP
jgi:3-deoxy-7-phosphoheptulonate synthase